MRCEPIGRRERGTGGRGGWRTGGKGQGRETEALRLRHQTDEDRTQPLFLLPRFPFDPFCCFAIHPLPPHVSSPCILILPIIPTSQFGQPFGCSGYLATPRPPPAARSKERKGIRISKGKRSPGSGLTEEEEGKGYPPPIDWAFFPSSAFNWHSLVVRKGESLRDLPLLPPAHPRPSSAAGALPTAEVEMPAIFSARWKNLRPPRIR